MSYGQIIPMFRLLAEGLARQGAAVYRYDKRTCFRENSDNRCPHSIGQYAGGLDQIFTADYILDARSAIEKLAQQPQIDPGDLTILGHSEGANYVPLILKDEPGVVAGVQLAGSSESIDKLIVEQFRDFASYLDQTDSQRYAAMIAALRADANRYETALQQMRADAYPLPRFEGLTVEQWRDWMSRTDNLQAEFQAVTKPIFVLNGDVDFNVAPRHLQQFQRWATERNMAKATFLLLANVTHSFVTLNAQRTGIDASFSPQALAAIADWHRSRVP